MPPPALTRRRPPARPQVGAFEREAVELLKPNHGTTTLGFIFQGGVIVAVDSRASQGSYICEPTGGPTYFRPHRAQQH